MKKTKIYPLKSAKSPNLLQGFEQKPTWMKGRCSTISGSLQGLISGPVKANEPMTWAFMPELKVSRTEKLEKIKFLSIPTSISMLQIIYKGRRE